MARSQRGGCSPAVRLVLLLALPAAAGCGVPQGRLSGRVLYQDRPLPGGRLTFRPADPRLNSVSVPIAPDGHYEATLPVGDVTICVDNRELQPVPRAGEVRLPPGVKLPAPEKQPEAPAPKAEFPGPAGTYVAIPEKYYQAETSGLTYAVKEGTDAHDIELR